MVRDAAPPMAVVARHSRPEDGVASARLRPGDPANAEVCDWTLTLLTALTGGSASKSLSPRKELRDVAGEEACSAIPLMAALRADHLHPATAMPTPFRALRMYFASSGVAASSNRVRWATPAMKPTTATEPAASRKQETESKNHFSDAIRSRVLSRHCFAIAPPPWG
jgi:hypothetical protein